ncbi:MAG: hypothetical protein IJ646_05990 [Clostridia bacterium]|nr:hypothetical protein [Clostridia bacterium]
MKHFFSGMMIALMLVLALVMGVVAMAETAEPEVPAIEDVQPAEDAQAPAGDAQATDDAAALQDALDAYDAARRSARIDDLEAELNEYVAAGKLTQEQADLILNHLKEREAQPGSRQANKGNCNNGGFSGGKGGRGSFGGNNGGKGDRGGFGGGRGMRGNGQQPDANTSPSVDPAPQAEGTAFTSDDGI